MRLAKINPLWSALAVLLPFVGVTASAESARSEFHLYYNGQPRVYQVSPSATGSSPYVRSPDPRIAQQTSAAIQSALSGSRVSLPSIPLPPPGASMLQAQREWISAAAAQLADPQTRALAQQSAKVPLKSLGEGNPFGVVDSLDAYFATIGKLNGIDPARGRALEGIGRGTFLDSQGTVNGLVDAPRVVDLVSPVSSAVGRDVRYGVNRLMVSKQVLEGEVRSLCETGAGAECTQAQARLVDFRNQYDQLMLMHAAAERMGLAGVAGYANVIGQLKDTADFYYGIAKGAYGSVENLITGLGQLVLHPIDTVSGAAVGLGNAIAHWDQTRDAIKGSIGKEWDTFLHGTSEQRGEVLGRVTVEVLTTLVPLVKGAGGAVRAMQSLRLVEGTTTLEKLTALSRMGKHALIREATIRAATTIAVMEKTADLVRTGKLASNMGRSITVVAKTFPRAMAEVLRGGVVDELALGETSMARSSASRLANAARADESVAALIRGNAKEAILFLNEHGPEALAGASRLLEGAPELLADFRKSGFGGELAALGREAMALSIEPSVLGKKSLMNLAQSSRELAAAGRAPSASLRTFLAQQAAASDLILPNSTSRVFTSADFSRVAESFTKLESAMNSASARAMEVEVWRGIRKELVLADGRIIVNLPTQIFDVNAWNTRANHRFSPPGRAAQYNSIGERAHAAEIIRLENRVAKVDELHLASQTLKFDKVLDLTDPIVRRTLGISKEAILAEGSYELTHQIAHLARQYGYEAILAPSSPARAINGINLIVFVK